MTIASIDGSPEHVVEVAVGLHVGVATRERAQRLGVAVAQPSQVEVGDLGEVAGEVRTPVPAADDPRSDRG